MNAYGSGSDAATSPSPVAHGLRVVRERWWLLVIVPLVCVVIALAMALTSQKQYEATAKLQLRESNIGTALLGVPDASQSDPQRAAATNLLLVTSAAVGQLVKKAMNTSESVSSLTGQVQAQSEPDSDLIDVVATDPDPQRAATLANQFATQFVNFRRAADQRTLIQGEQDLQQRLSQLGTDQQTERQTLQRALSTLQALQVVTTGNAQVVDPAGAPGAPSSPKTKLDVIVALLLGIGLALSIAWLIDLLDRRVKTVDDFERLYNVRALGTVPLWHREPANERERNVQLEPYRIVRNGLPFLAIGSDVKTILVTSAVSGEGKSTVAAGLARAAALSGQRVILCEVDLRRPSLAAHFDLGDDNRGLTTALVGGMPARDLLRHPLPGLRSFSVLPSGPLPPNSAELLRSTEMPLLLEELRREADILILDAPPLLPVADAQVLLDSPQVDACLVVARTFFTTRDQARRSHAVLERHRIENVGLVVNALKGAESGYDYYDYSSDEEPVRRGPLSGKRGNGARPRAVGTRS